MADMVEPDRTILIVSLIGLVVIWGSFFYHKYVQGGPRSGPADAAAKDGPAADAEADAGGAPGESGPEGRRGKRKR